MATVKFNGLNGSFTTTRGMRVKPTIGTTVIIRETEVVRGVKRTIRADVTIVGVGTDNSGRTVYVVRGLHADCAGYYEGSLGVVFVECDG